MNHKLYFKPDIKLQTENLIFEDNHHKHVQIAIENKGKSTNPLTMQENVWGQ